MKLHLGVVDIPYTVGGVTTGDVATFLESKYDVMQTFYDNNDQKVALALEDGLRGHLENLLLGAPPSATPFASGTSEIDHMFQSFIETGQMEKMGLPGVPTKAAIERRSSRFKKKRAKKARPSFVDTGLYVANFKSWID